MKKLWQLFIFSFKTRYQTNVQCHDKIFQRELQSAKEPIVDCFQLQWQDDVLPSEET